MPNPLWVDARDLLSSQGHSLNTYNLNNAMDFLANNPQLRPSVVKAGGSGNEAAIGAGLGAPTDQIVSTPLAPPRTNRSSPAKSSGAGGGRSGASTGGSASTRPAPAPPVAKPQSAQDPVSPTGDPLQQLVPPASSPVTPATAAPAADAEGGLGTGGRLAVGAAGVTALLAALLGLRGGGGGGMRPRGSLEGEVIPPSPVARTGGAPGGPTIEGAVDPIQQLLGNPQRQIEGPAGNQVVPSNSIPMRDATSGPAMTTPTLEDIIAQLVNQTPPGESPAPPQLPPSLPPGGKPMRNITGTTRGTKAPKR